MINVLLVDDHELVRTGLRFILNDAHGIRVFAEAATGEEAIECVRKKHPDVVLMDINMPGIGGVEAISRLLHINSNLRLVVLSVQGESPYPARLLQMGAKGYLTKGCPAEEMILAIRTVHGGGRYISSDVAQKLALNLLPGGKTSPIEELSDREMQVLLMVVDGQGLQDIAEKLCVSPKTVGTYRHRLYDKLGCSNDVELTHLAMRSGITSDSFLDR